MTKVRVYDGTEEEPIVFFRLEEWHTSIGLIACNSDGERLKAIACITNNGTLEILPSAKVKGLRTNSTGHILVEFREQ